MTRTALVFAGGDPLTPAQIDRLGDADVVIGADSGVDRAREAGQPVDVAVGDFDSISDDSLEYLKARGVDVVAHPEVKNETDLELALLHAVELGSDQIHVVGLDGGRPDHYLANLLLLADRRLSGATVTAQFGDSLLHILHSGVHDTLELAAEEGRTVSILPLGGDAVGVRTSGLLYPLRGETLTSSSPRGMSNVVSTSTISVAVGGGTVAVIL